MVVVVVVVAVAVVESLINEISLFKEKVREKQTRVMCLCGDGYFVMYR